MVVGSWLWDEQLQMGFTTEIDADDAYEIARFTDYALAILSFVTTLLLLLLMTVLDRGHRRMAEQSRELRMIIDGSPVAMVLADNLGNIERAKRKAEADENSDMKRYLSEALNNSYRARDLVAQIASFSRNGSTDKREQRLD